MHTLNPVVVFIALFFFAYAFQFRLKCFNLFFFSITLVVLRVLIISQWIFVCFFFGFKNYWSHSLPIQNRWLAFVNASHDIIRVFCVLPLNFCCCCYPSLSFLLLVTPMNHEIKLQMHTYEEGKKCGRKLEWSLATKLQWLMKIGKNKRSEKM